MDNKVYQFVLKHLFCVEVGYEETDVIALEQEIQKLWRKFLSGITNIVEMSCSSYLNRFPP